MKRILNYPGSKWSIAGWIIEHMPEHDVYLEPFFGSGAVFFNKQPSKIETVNDIDSRIVNLFKMLRDNQDELSRLVDFTPFSREEYRIGYIDEGTDLERARRFIVKCWMGIGAKQDASTGWRSSISVNGHKPNEWHNLSSRIEPIAKRLKNAQIENQSALELIKRYNRENVLIYADPPYPHDTRQKKYYKYEMKNQEHELLLETLLQHKGPVILSSYENELYDRVLVGWKKKFFAAIAESGAKRTETIYLNQAAYEGSSQLTIFD